MISLSKILKVDNSLGHGLSDIFPREMFWDIDMDNLSLEKDSDFIIQRVLSRSMHNSEYLGKLEKLSSIKKIREIALQSSEIRGNEDIEFIAERYQLRPEQFKKYISNLSMYA